MGVMHIPGHENQKPREVSLEEIRSVLGECRLCELLEPAGLQELIDTDGGSFAKPWFGQLMMGPQLLAYFIQLELWLRRYQIRIEF